MRSTEASFCTLIYVKARSGAAIVTFRPGSKPTQLHFSSNALPQTGLLVEAIKFHAAEIKPGNDADDFAIVDDWQMAVATVFHEPECFDRDLARRYRVGIKSHNLGEHRSRGAFSLSEHAVNGITAGENSQETLIAIGDQNRADAAVAHTLAGLFDGSTGWERDGILVPDDVGHLPHGLKPFSSD